MGKFVFPPSSYGLQWEPSAAPIINQVSFRKGPACATINYDSTGGHFSLSVVYHHFYKQSNYTTFSKAEKGALELLRSLAENNIKLAEKQVDESLALLNEIDEKIKLQPLVSLERVLVEALGRTSGCHCTDDGGDIRALAAEMAGELVGKVTISEE